MIPEPVLMTAREVASRGGLPAYVYDLPGLAAQAAAVRSAVGRAGVELFYAAKANPDPELLRVLAGHVDGFEVASGGELEHVRRTLPGARIAFGGPGKTEAELATAVRLGAERIHVESPGELGRLLRLLRKDPDAGRPVVDVLLRANLALGTPGAALAMDGPFGMDGAGLATCAALLREGAATTGVRLRGIHVHLASGLSAPAMVELAVAVLDQVVPWLRDSGCAGPPFEVNLGGGMGVDYADPGARFDWDAYATGLAGLAPPDVRLRIEPGRAISVHCGYYVTDVLDVKVNHGRGYAVVRGGTHHLRTPATKGHDQPCTVVGPGGGRHGAGLEGGFEGPVTIVGQLCTPKDVLARDVPVTGLVEGDLVVFAMAGAYAWNISHHDFLMHPHPGFHYVIGT